MIDIFTGELKDLWPDNKEPEFLAFSYAIKGYIDIILEHDRRSMIYADIDNLPEEILDHLAVEWRAMYYTQDLDIDTKRTIIKNTLIWYMGFGTAGTMEELMKVIFGVGSVVENWEFDDEPIGPYLFDVLTDAPDQLVTWDIINYVATMVNKIKNARSHLRRIGFNRKIDSGVKMATGVYSYYGKAIIPILLEILIHPENIIGLPANEYETMCSAVGYVDITLVWECIIPTVYDSWTEIPFDPEYGDLIVAVSDMDGDEIDYDEIQIRCKVSDGQGQTVYSRVITLEAKSTNE